MGTPNDRPLRALVRALVVSGATLALAFASCKAKQATSAAHLRIELVPVAGPTQPRNARVVLTPADGASLPVCVNVVGAAGTTTASLVLERASDRDASIPVAIEVTPYDAMNGELGPGQEFTCPAVLPPELGPGQRLETSFCAGESRRVVFHLTSGCGCSHGTGGSGGGGAGGEAGSGGASGGAGGSVATGGTTNTGGANGGGGSGGVGGVQQGGGGAGGGGGATTCCALDQVCGAGVSTTGASCDPGQCCKGTLLDACSALETPL